MRKFEFKKSYEEVEIAGEVYRMEMNDEKIKEHQKAFGHFYKELETLKSKTTGEVTIDEEHETFDKTKELLTGIINQLLGDGSFDKLYDAAGGSLFNLLDLLFELADIVEEHSKRDFEERKSKYTKKRV